MLVLHQDTWNTVLCNMRRVTSSTISKWLAHNSLDLEFSSGRSWLAGMLIIFQLSFPCVKRLCQFNTALWPKGASPNAYLIIWNVLLVNLPNFWQKVAISHCSNCDILNFHWPQTPTLHNSDFLSEYTVFLQLLLAGPEKNGCCTILWLHVSAVQVVHNSPTMRPIHEITDYTSITWSGILCMKRVLIFSALQCSLFMYWLSIQGKTKPHLKKVNLWSRLPWGADSVTELASSHWNTQLWRATG
jgi:hypothetical protein